MAKFKVGDIVVGNQDSEANGVEQGQLYQVLATEIEHGFDYVKTDLGGFGGWVLSERFDLYKSASQVEQDDPLPPAPESVLYLKEGGQRKLTASMYPSSVSIKIHLEYPSTVKCLGYSMEPDAALQLAHDLNRMAMEIKRKEKQRG